MSLRLFLERIVHSSQYPIQQHLVAALLNQIRIEREGYAINQSSVKGCLHVFLTLNNESQVQVYKADFEPSFLQESAAFYKEEGNILSESISVPEYLQRVSTSFAAAMKLKHLQVESRLTSEENRTKFMICAASWDALRAILEDHLITNHVPTILSGLEAMIETDSINDLSRLYRILYMVSTGIPSLRRSLKDSISHRGKNVNEASLRIGEPEGDADEGAEDVPKGKGKGKEKPPGAMTYALSVAHKWVEDVLALKDKFDRILKNAFNSDVGIQTAFNEVRDLSLTEYTDIELFSGL